VTDSSDLLTVSLRAYREGYKAALATVALAFGIAPQAITLRQAQDKALRQPQGETLQFGRKSEVAYLSPEVRRVEEREEALLQTLGSGEEP
jgi:hypothetical protein